MRSLLSTDLEHHRDHRLLALAHVAPLAREEQVLRELLGDGRAAGDHRALALVLLERALDPLQIEALVIGELRVLGDDHRALQMGRDPRRSRSIVASAAPSDCSRAARRAVPP